MSGYSPIKEFYSPDYRRTLYWNPAVTFDETGRARIQFYNNSSCTNFTISAETITSSGKIGTYNK